MSDSGIDIGVADIFFDGYVRLYRQQLDKPFTPDNILNIESDMKSLSAIQSAVE